MPAFRPARGLLSGVVASAALVLAIAPAAALAADASLDDRTLTRSSKGWSDAKDSKAASGTLSKAKKKGATLTATTAAKDGGSIVVQVAKGRGSLSVTVGGKKRTTISTSARKKAFRSFSFKGAGTVKLTVTKLGGGVFVDAIKLKGVPQPVVGDPRPTTGPTPTPAPVPGGTLTPPSVSPVNLGPLKQVNTSAAGVPQDGSQVTNAVVSPSGRFVAFWAKANNLVPGVTDDRMHVYVKNLATGAINVADKDANGNLSNGTPLVAAEALTWKPDETEIAFSSLGTNITNVAGLSAPYLITKDLADGVPTGVPGVLADRVSQAAWSPDGTKVAFSTTGSYCANTPPGVGCSGGSDSPKIYSYDIATEKHTPISATQAGAQPVANGGPSGSSNFVWSPDSSKIAFVSDGNALVPGDSNVAADVFVKNLSDLSIQRISLTGTGGQANRSSDQPAWSPDGTKVAFQSDADNLTVGDNNSGTDVFVRDLSASSTTVISTGEDGGYKLFGSRTPRWSPDGTKIAFGSNALDLIPGFLDNNKSEDVYVRTFATGKLQLASVRPDGVQGSHNSVLWGMAGNTGGWIGNNQIVFRSGAVNFPTADGNGNAFQEDLFLKTLN